MSKLNALMDLQFEAPPVPSAKTGARGELKWLPVSKLFIDPAYQRGIEGAGKRNIGRIIENFHWSKFSPLIVARREGGRYAIIDGQHRATGARLHGGITELPCLILKCSPAEEADAFAVINGNVTRMLPQYVFRARLAAGDKKAKETASTCAAAGVRIMPYVQAAGGLKVGETLAVGSIEDALAKSGRTVLIAALSLITKTGDGNPGFVKAAVIKAFTRTLHASPKWLENMRGVYAAVEKKTLRKIYADATERTAASNDGLATSIGSILSEVLRRELGDGGEALVQTPAAQKREIARKENPVAATDPAAKKTPPQQDTRKLIEDHLRTKGVRRIDSGASGNPSNVIDWLRRNGVEIEHVGTSARGADGRRVGWGKYRLNGKIVDFTAVIARVNKLRRKQGLEPLTIGEKAA